MKFRPSYLIPAFAVLAANSAIGATFDWRGSTSTDWATGGNWLPTSAPAYGSTQTGRLLINGTGTAGAIYDSGAGVTTTFTGADSGAERGLFIGQVAAGSLSVKSGNLVVGGTSDAGMANAANAKLTIDGGNLTIGNATFFTVFSGVGSGSITSELTVNSGSFTAKSIDLYRSGGTATNAAGTINLNGGTFAATQFVRSNASATTPGSASTINLNGGVLKNAGTTNNANFFNAFANTTVVVKSGGAKIDSGSFDITIAAPLTHDATLGATADGGLIKTGASALTLSGANTYTGTTAINAGALVVTNATGLGTTAGGTTVALNAALALSGGINYSSAESVTLTGPGLTVASGVFAAVQRGSLTSVSGTNTFAGNISFSDSGNTRIGVQNGASLILTGNITESAANSSMIFRHSSTGVGNITLSGTGNSWTGNTNIFGGEGAVILGVNNAIPTTSLLVVGTTGTGTASTLDLNGKVQTVKGISEVTPGFSNGVITNNGTADSTLTLANLSADQSFGGVIKDGGTNKVGLTLNSSGKIQTLSGTNTYTGATTVSAGTLVVNGSLANTSTNIGSGGALKGTGTIGGTVGVNGTLAPGNSIGTLNFSQTLTLGGIADFEIDPTLGLGLDRASDLANVTGAVTYGGILNVLYGGSNANFTNGMIFNLFDGASFSGSFSAINLPDLTGTGLSWQNNLSSNGTLAVVPEPGAALLGGLGMLALLRRRRA